MSIKIDVISGFLGAGKTTLIKKLFKIVVFIIAFLTFLVSIYFIVFNYLQNSRNEKANNKLIKEVINMETKYDEKINWSKLTQVNKDIIGWIEIPNTNINYPILKDENLYYLTHNFEGKSNKNGSIFIRNDNIDHDQYYHF